MFRPVAQRANQRVQEHGDLPKPTQLPGDPAGFEGPGCELWKDRDPSVFLLVEPPCSAQGLGRERKGRELREVNKDFTREMGRTF